VGPACLLPWLAAAADAQQSNKFAEPISPGILCISRTQLT
jgi:hypothetical protein